MGTDNLDPNSYTEGLDLDAHLGNANDEKEGQQWLKERARERATIVENKTIPPYPNGFLKKLPKSKEKFFSVENIRSIVDVVNASDGLSVIWFLFILSCVGGLVCVIARLIFKR